MGAKRENIVKSNDPETDVSRFMAEARSGQVSVDLEAWVPKLEAFIEQQPGIKDRVVVRDVQRPATGTAGGNAQFTAEFNRGDGRRAHRFVVRFEPPTRLLHEYDMPAMFKVLGALQGTGVPAPKPLWLDAKGEFLGVPAFIMEFVEGSAPRQSYFKDGPIAEANPSERRTMVSSVIETIAKIHAVDWKTRGLAFLNNRGRGKTFIERDISWYWSFLESTLPERLPDYIPIRKWLLDNQPVVEEGVLNHGDCQLGNYMFRGAKVAAVLDWDTCCLLPPEADIAYLCWFNEYASTGMDKLPAGIPPEKDWLAEYERVSGHQIQHWEYYRMMMIYRWAVIFCCCSARTFSPDMLKATRSVWGWFEDTLMEKASHLCG
jgi:aminoglycoside phosphotransferase (APT) family kinase protein